jgi:hypothetical protein
LIHYSIVFFFYKLLTIEYTVIAIQRFLTSNFSIWFTIPNDINILLLKSSYTVFLNAHHWLSWVHWLGLLLLLARHQSRALHWRVCKMILLFNWQPQTMLLFNLIIKLLRLRIIIMKYLLLGYSLVLSKERIRFIDQFMLRLTFNLTFNRSLNLLYTWNSLSTVRITAFSSCYKVCRLNYASPVRPKGLLLIKTASGHPHCSGSLWILN